MDLPIGKEQHHGGSPKTEEELEAFRTDLHLAGYAERVEKGLLTPEEQACRDAVREFILGGGLDKDQDKTGGK